MTEKTRLLANAAGLALTVALGAGCAMGGGGAASGDDDGGGDDRADGTGVSMTLVSCWQSQSSGRYRVTCSVPDQINGVAISDVMVKFNDRDVQVQGGKSVEVYSGTSAPPSTIAFRPNVVLQSSVVGAPNFYQSSATYSTSLYSSHTQGSPLKVDFPYSIWRVSAVSTDLSSVIVAFEDRSASSYPFVSSNYSTAKLLGGSMAVAGTDRLFAIIVPKGTSSLSGQALGGGRVTISGPGHYSVSLASAIKLADKAHELSEPEQSGTPEEEQSGGGNETPSTPTETCVAGTSYDCSSSGGTWNSSTSKCCFSGNLQCQPGLNYECDDSGEKWSGSQCCVPADLICGNGLNYECDDSGEYWTGSKCCVAASLCTTGVNYECDDTGELWTGSQCCLSAANVQCVAGVNYECDDSGENWTGTLCCVAASLNCHSGSSYSCSGNWTGTQCCE